MSDEQNVTKGSSSLASLSHERREEFWASLALRYTSGIGCITAKRLLVEYGSASEAMRDIKGWSRRASISARVIENILSNKWRESARKEWEHAGRIACELLLWPDANYPELLKEISAPPLFLYCKGDVSLLSNPSIGVVGSRRCSHEGVKTTADLSKTLSASGVTTVSGLARGIDSVAHEHALSGWGSTVAVLGTGISHVYPPENEPLFYSIAEKGLVISEFPPNAPPEAKNFPMRNRIISGLSLGVLVVEATPKSGSLITARHALEQGREVFAVPGKVQSRTSSGCHDLIRQGATAVFSCDDILVSIAPLLGMEFATAKQEVKEVQVKVADEPSPQEQVETADIESDKIAYEPVEMPEVVSDDLSIEEQLKAIPEVIEIPCDTPYQFDEPETVDVPVPETKKKNQRHVEVPEKKNVDRKSFEEKIIDMSGSLEEQIMQALKGEEAVHIDAIGRKLSVPAATVSTALLMMEVAGQVQQLSGMNYRLS